MWYYRGKHIKDITDFPEGAVGFVYQIQNLITERKYIGKKILKTKKTKPPLKGYKRKRVSFVESTWKTYTGSNITSKKWIIEECSREILHICFDKTMMSYYETKEQFKLGAIEDDSFLNDNIGGKYYRKRIETYNERYNQNKGTTR